ncbi:MULTISPECIES: hypothetical protein [Pandoraea]|uniref:hypothetical protein n=1 Tax=Pandoraea TaxID=93217 RepID=UPI001F5E2AC9|nr:MULTISPECIES: hypothetical protein [Pandoraea]MCI3208553.1 hypothetical protein [Pandoraea sp. LA3]MDN4586582.1 hypothetical protein [Pandoraea capi]
MSVFLIMVPAAITLLGASGTTAAVGVGAVAGASAFTGVAVVGSTIAGMTVGLMVKHGKRANTLVYQTHLNRRDLLEQTLSNLGYRTDNLNEGLSAKHGEMFLLFEGNEAGTFDGVVDKNVPETVTKRAFEAIYAEYTRLVQVETYVSLLKEAKKHGLTLESETVEEDNSISLTFLVTQKNG